MKMTIVYAHPYDKSFNHAVLEEVKAVSGDCYVIDLYADGFNPVLTREELAVYGKGQSLDPLVATYNQILDDTNRIVFIFPMWWYDMPAMMRGFLDKVMLEGSAYYTDNTGLHPIRNIAETYLFTTASTPTEVLMDVFRNPMGAAHIADTLEIVGCHNIKWLNLGAIDGTTEEQRKVHLAQVRELLRG